MALHRVGIIVTDYFIQKLGFNNPKNYIMFGLMWFTQMVVKWESIQDTHS